MSKWTHSNWDYVFSQAAKKALTAIGVKMTAEARAYATGNVRTGRLKGSLTWSVQGHKSNVDAKAKPSDAVSEPPDRWTCYVGTNVEYAPHVEYGTRFTKGRSWPYLRPAMDENRDWANQRFKKELHEAILRYGQ